jgi:hypothetical protein
MANMDAHFGIILVGGLGTSVAQQHKLRVGFELHSYILDASHIFFVCL